MTISTQTVASKLDRWIVGTVRPDDTRLLLDAGASLDIADAQSVVEEARAAGLHDPMTAGRDTIIRVFGEPGDQAPGKIRYDLTLWPDHSFEWSLDGQGRVMHSTFVRRSPGSREKVQLGTSAATQLRTRHDTEDDVRSWFGAPTSEEGWWPEHSLVYALPDASRLLLTFHHGLLSAVRGER